MAKALTDEQVARFRAQGFLGPLDMMDSTLKKFQASTHPKIAQGGRS